jgi:hypothetical protein
MSDFRQHYKRQKSAMGLFLCLAFAGIIISAFFNADVPAGLKEDAPWLFWGMIIVSSIGALGFIWQLSYPPLIVAADADGITLGRSFHSPVINLSIRNFNFKSRADSRVAWEKVRSIGVSEVFYETDNVRMCEPALRIEFDDSIDLGNFGDMHAMRSGTKAYFAAVKRKKSDRSVFYQQPQGMHAKQNIVLIGEQHFDENVHQVCDRLRKLAARYSEAYEYDPLG